MHQNETQHSPGHHFRLLSLLQGEKGAAHLFAQPRSHCCRAGPLRKGVIAVSWAAMSPTSARVVLALLVLRTMAVLRWGKSIPKPFHCFLILSTVVSTLFYPVRWARQDKRPMQGFVQLRAPARKEWRTGDEGRRRNTHGRVKLGGRSAVVALSKEAGQTPVEGERVGLAGRAILFLLSFLLLRQHHPPHMRRPAPREHT